MRHNLFKRLGAVGEGGREGGREGGKEGGHPPETMCPQGDILACAPA
jgi:hypothetical protein